MQAQALVKQGLEIARKIFVGLLKAENKKLLPFQLLAILFLVAPLLCCLVRVIEILNDGFKCNKLRIMKIFLKCSCCNQKNLKSRISSLNRQIKECQGYKSPSKV